MKTKWMIAMTGLAVAGVVYFAMPMQRVEAQSGTPQSAGASPIGRVVDVTLVAWPLTTQVAGTVSGNLLSMSSEWITVKEGSYEHWIPKEKVLKIKISR